MTIETLKSHLLHNGKIMWDDPIPIVGNDYTINAIWWDSNFEEDSDLEISIKYNNMHSDAQVYLHEINILI